MMFRNPGYLIASHDFTLSTEPSLTLHLTLHTQP